MSVFGIGSGLDDKRWRSVIRALAARGWLNVDHDAYGALKLTDAARPVLKGEVEVWLREPAARTRPSKRRATVDLGADTALFERLRDWRRQTALTHDVPAYVILHDATLREIAARKPATLVELGGISGIGARKLEAYGTAILAVLRE